MQYLITIAVLVIAATAAIYLYRKYMESRRRAVAHSAIHNALDLSKDTETAWVDILVKARARMPAEQYESFQSAVLEFVSYINTVKRSGLKTETEKMALLEKLASSSKNPEMNNIVAEIFSE